MHKSLVINVFKTIGNGYLLINTAEVKSSHFWTIVNKFRVFLIFEGLINFFVHNL